MKPVIAAPPVEILFAAWQLKSAIRSMMKLPYCRKKLSTTQEKLESTSPNNHTQLRPDDDVPDTTHDEGAGSDRDQFEKDIDKALDFTKFAMRRLFGVVKELQKEYAD